MRILQNFSFTEKLLLAGIAGLTAFYFAYRFVNGPAKDYEFPERNLAIFSLIKADIDNCPNYGTSRIVSQRQMDPEQELARYIDCGNKGFLAAGDAYTDFYNCFYIFDLTFRPIPYCKSQVPISSLDMDVEMAAANRDYQELLKLIGEK